MGSPFFLWTAVRTALLGAVALVIALLFWVGAVAFLLINLVLAWFHLWRWIGVWNLVTLRFLMRWRNLYDTAQLPNPPPGDPRALPWENRFQYQRTASGIFNDLQDPRMGSAGTRFGRNFPLERLLVDERRFLDPNPRDISRSLLTRGRFRPATSLNLLAAAWIQFMVHDWFNHKRRDPADPPPPGRPPVPLHLPDVPVTENDPWPGTDRNRRGERVMMVRRTAPDLSRVGDDPPTFINTETHWWDGSQVYGSDQIRQDLVRARNGLGHLRITNGRLPRNDDPAMPGVDLSGFTDNWWVGLSLLHTLFALEHNAICDRLVQAYPEWDDERLFQTARLINAALMAKIHTVEWTPAILGSPTLLIGMKANWWGILTQRITQSIGRFKVLRGIQEEISGIPGSERDHHYAPFYLTEEFVSVYRMHPLIPDDYRFYDIGTDELLREWRFDEIQGNRTRPILNTVGLENAFYSFGITYPGEITLHNFPRALQRFTRVKDGTVRNELLDLGVIDIMRDRERAIPRYNQFRRLLLLLPIASYRQLVHLPRFRLFSGLTHRDMKERAHWVEELNRLYPDPELLDPMVGFFAEQRPKGFGFSDTAFRIFILMASRRLKSDRFFTTDYKPEVYTQIGIDWIDHNTFKTVLQRHYPALAGSLADVDNPFSPWTRAGQPSPDPTQPKVKAAYAPMFVGVAAGWVIGSLRYLLNLNESLSLQAILSAVVQKEAVLGVITGGVLGAACMGTINLISLALTGRLTARQRAEIFGSFGALTGGTLNVIHQLDATWWGWRALHRAVVSAPAAKWAAVGIIIGVIIARTYDLLSLVRSHQSLAPSHRVELGVIPGLLLGWLIGIVGNLHGTWRGWHAFADAALSGQAITGAVVGLGIGAALATIYDSMRAIGLWPMPRGRHVAWIAFTGAAVGGVFAVLHELGGNWREWSAWQNAIVNGNTVLWVAVCACLGAVVAAVHGWFVNRFPAHATQEATVKMRPLVRAGMVALFGGGILLVLAILADLYGILVWLTSQCSALLISVAVGALLGITVFLYGSFRRTPLPMRQPKHVVIRLACHAGVGVVSALLLGLLHAAVVWLTGDGPNLLTIFAGPLLGAAVGALAAAVGSVAIGTLITALTGGVIGIVLVFLGVVSAPFFKGLGSVWAWDGLLVGMVVGAVWGAKDARCLCSNAGWLVVRASQCAIIGLVLGALLFAMRDLFSTPFALETLWKNHLRGAGFHGALIAALLAGTAWLYWTTEVKWYNRGAFWDVLGWAKFMGNKPLDIPPPSPVCNLALVRLRDAIPEIPIDRIEVVKRDDIPSDERSRLKDYFTRVQVWLYSAYPPMQADLLDRPIAADANRALRHAYRWLHRTKFDPPDLPPEYEGSPDLGGLAVRGPYACYTKRIDRDTYEWDVMSLRRYPSRAELYQLGARVLFRHDPVLNKLVPFRIETAALPDATPGQDHWQLAKKVALCSLTTHLSLIRHFNWVHLASTAHLAVATRALPADHALRRLLWPHVFGTQQSNDVVTRAQMVEGGDFDCIFSFAHREMCRCFEDSYDEFSLVLDDPEEDGNRRGIRGGSLPTPTQNDLERLFEVIHRHATRFLRLHPAIFTDPQLRRSIEAWLDALNGPRRIPGGVGVTRANLTRATLARLCARFIYLVTVEHEMVGSFLWNYQLWTHRQPIRVYRNGQREPLDIYQRLVNANYNLNVNRRLLLDDPVYLGVEDRDRRVFLRFQRDLKRLADEWRAEPWRVWRLYPEALKVNINA